MECERAMRVGVGLPNAVPGVEAPLLLDWARRADEGPFSSVVVIDRFVYDSYEPFASLAAAAAVTRRVQLATTIAIGPLRNTAAMAKAAVTIDALSAGRLVLGLAVGARPDDYALAGVDYRQRGRLLSQQLDELHALWDVSEVGPHRRRRRPQLLIGGLSDQAFARVARFADGYVHGGGPARALARAADRVRAAWRDAGRPGNPQIWGQAYFALGAAALAGSAYLADYYAFTGPFAEKIAAGLLVTPQQVVQHMRAYVDAGCDHLVLLPAVAELEQLERLGDALADAVPDLEAAP
jgi:alkanesulfonate monooxygenase SsuD/methylene tetrahydromethanopterin reductase-like flavin-dependent oxidoreductase (luciferase family)